MGNPKIDVHLEGGQGVAVIGFRFPRGTDPKDIDACMHRLTAEIAKIDNRPHNLVAEALHRNREQSNTVDKIGWFFEHQYSASDFVERLRLRLQSIVIGSPDIPTAH